MCEKILSAMGGNELGKEVREGHGWGWGQLQFQAGEKWYLSSVQSGE